MPLQGQVMVRAAGGHEHEAPAHALRDLQAQGVAIEGLGPIEVRDLQVHVPNRGHPCQLIYGQERARIAQTDSPNREKSSSSPNTSASNSSALSRCPWPHRARSHSPASALANHRSPNLSSSA